MIDPAEAAMDWPGVYKRIREAAMELGVDLYDIAEFLGLDPKSPDYVAKYSALPKMQTAVKVAAFLGVPAAWVLAGKGQPKHRLNIQGVVDSTVVQGNQAGTLIINNGQKTSDLQKELMRLFDSLNIRGQVMLLHKAYELAES